MKIQVRDFDLDHIFDCGQAFRWRKLSDGSYTGVALGSIVNMRFDAQGKGYSGELEITTLAGDKNEEKWRTYLDLDSDYGAAKRRLADADPVIAEAIKSGEGIRILRQELWEVILSFLISQNNNIPRIKGCIEGLASLCGEPIRAAAGRRESEECPGGLTAFRLPSAEKLSGMEPGDLSPIRLGYRARYIIETARKITSDGFPSSPEELTELCGVGPKVANCISLFGMGITDSFPIDVWMKKVMAQMYGFEENDVKGMTSFATDRFGELSGLAQQYLFYFIRCQSASGGKIPK